MSIIVIESQDKTAPSIVPVRLVASWTVQLALFAGAIAMVTWNRLMTSVEMTSGMPAPQGLATVYVTAMAVSVVFGAVGFVRGRNSLSDTLLGLTAMVGPALFALGTLV